MLCGIFSLIIILVHLVLVYIPICLCVTLHLTRLWMCHCSFGPFLSRSAVAGSGRSRSALGLAGIVAFSSSLTSVLSRHTSGIPLSMAKKLRLNEVKAYFLDPKAVSRYQASLPLPAAVLFFLWAFNSSYFASESGSS